ncbi:MAG: bifunctional UDP-3-O-[3-hydroxymyristoyl] N-acetylglucosamine deacetylase/3-hydroxyacyl-ACP dehydratase [Candidatus Eiseniibacteriota bacterium]|nr:MAG: bifunctional UDP-3-O-[3-hydroxymyristoyl] N-acetylglucosamine deacetylase/3-hydroxyacyl-ACP dehydratase [Candidatus Eisenbacteria bacterium]
MLKHQRTIEREVSYEGTGLHTGRKCVATFKPAPVDHGIRFVRIDLPGRPEVLVSAKNAKYEDSAGRRTILADGSTEVHTVEHILATLAGLGIDNVIIELDSLEAAEAADGSAAPFVELLRGAGLVKQSAPKKYFKVTKPVFLQDDDVELLAVPYNGLKISFTIEYENPWVGTQHASFELDDEVFADEIAPARTFVLFKDVDELRARGLIKGGSPENAVVVQDDGIMDDEPLRFANEFVRHKILDFLGDLFLLGRPLMGHFIAVRSGHESNVKFVKKLNEQIKPDGFLGLPSRGGRGHLGIDAIQQIMPHRYPVLLVDRILELEDRKRVVGIKNVTINEPFFQGHFPGHPIMPAVLIIEAMAQVGGVLLLSTVDDPREKLVYFMGIDNAKFRKPVLPGDQLRFELELVRLRHKICKMKGKAFVDGELVAEADLLSTIVDR